MWHSSDKQFMKLFNQTLDKDHQHCQKLRWSLDIQSKWRSNQLNHYVYRSNIYEASTWNSLFDTNKANSYLCLASLFQTEIVQKYASYSNDNMQQLENY